MKARTRTAVLLGVLLPLLACGPGPASSAEDGAAKTGTAPATSDASQAVATFAGGCFWCMEAPFDELPGVRSTTSGYIGGHVETPTYEQVSAGGTGHTEAVQVLYDPDEVTKPSLAKLTLARIIAATVLRMWKDEEEWRFLRSWLRTAVPRTVVSGSTVDRTRVRIRGTKNMRNNADHLPRVRDPTVELLLSHD